MAWDNEYARQQVGQVEQMLTTLGSSSDLSATQAMDTVQLLVGLYGECLARVMECITESGNGEVASALTADELVSHLLLVHDLHPVDAESRVGQAVEQVRQEPAAADAEIELVDLSGGIARVRMAVSGCASTAQRIQHSVEQAVAKAAPETERVEFEQVPPSASTNVIPVEALFSAVKDAG